MLPLQLLDSAWARSHVRPRLAPLWVALALVPLVAVWTLPQTLAGLGFALYRRLQGRRIHAYQLGPFLFLVVRARGPASAGISLGLVVFADRPPILKHEFCHLFTALWLSWLYLPVYAAE